MQPGSWYLSTTLHNVTVILTSGPLPDDTVIEVANVT